MNYIVIYGDPITGFKAAGPFPAKEDRMLNEYCEKHFGSGGTDYWIMILESPTP